MPRTFIKDPHAILDYTINWEDWLGSDTISTSSWTVPTGITKVSDSKTNTTTTIWLKEGVDRTIYEVTNRIVTNAARTDDRTIVIQVMQK